MQYTDLPQDLNLTTYFLGPGKDDRTALITPSGPVTYGELAASSHRFGNALRRLGVRRGDRVLLALRDGHEFVAAWYGAQAIGAITAEAYTHLTAADYRYFLEYVQPTVVVADNSTLARIREAGAGCTVVVTPDCELEPAEHDWAELIAHQSSALVPVGLAPDEVAIWKFTSGSTGRPKACPLPACAPVLSSDWYGRGVLGLRPDDLVLPVPKLTFGYARDLATLFPFQTGAAGIVFPERSTPEKIFELIARYQPSILVNVPAMMSAMISHPTAATADLSCVRLCTSAGEALPAELHRRWLETFGVEVVDGIGSSEAYHIYLSNRPGQSRMGSLGQAVPGYRLRIVDELDASVPTGEVGVLVVEGETVCRGYWQASEKSAVSFPAAHTVRTGDLFSQDDEGFFHYRGRTDDLIKIRGIWVAPPEVENALLQHPAVRQCAVVGVPVEGLTQLRAFAVTDGTASRVELRSFLRGRLAPYKCPRDIRLVDSLPENGAGKVDRHRLTTLDPAGTGDPR